MTLDPAFKTAYRRRPLLNLLVSSMWLGAFGFGAVAAVRLLTGGLRRALPAATVAFACLVTWYVIHNHALVHPKE